MASGATRALLRSASHNDSNVHGHSPGRPVGHRPPGLPNPLQGQNDMKQVSSHRARWLAQYVVPHERAIRAGLLRRTRDLDIDDIVQEMYARLASLDDVETIRNPRQYATQAAVSIALNMVRHARVVPMNVIGDFAELELASVEPSPERALDSRDELRALERTLAALPDLCRTAFLLRRVEGLSQREVADKLGISVKTVEKYMAKSVRLLLDQYGRGGAGVAQVSSSGKQEDGRREIRRSHDGQALQCRGL